jgi:hypothetical protein
LSVTAAPTATLELPASALWRVLSVVSLGAGSFVLTVLVAMSLGKPRPLVLRCDRAQSACVIDNGATQRSFPFGEIARLKAAKEYHMHDGERAWISLTTKAGAQEFLCDASTSIAATKNYPAMVEPLNAVLTGAAASAELRCDEGVSTVVERLYMLFQVALLFGFGFMLGRLASTRRAELGADGTLVVTDSGWFRRPSRRAIDVKDVKRVDLTRNVLTCALADGSQVLLSRAGLGQAEQRQVEAFRQQLASMIR